MPRAAAPTSDHHLLAASALGFEPRIRASGLIRRGPTFGDDAFEIQPAGRLQYGIAGFGQMFDELDNVSCSAAPIQKALQALLALDQRQAPQILTFGMENIEHEIRQIL